MIYDTGYREPTKSQRNLARQHGDDSFINPIPAGFNLLHLPMREGWEYDLSTGIVLKMRCVDPHMDTWLGTEPEPKGKRRAAFFWLVNAPTACDFYLQVGGECRQLSHGDWVLFDDRVLHCVTAKNTWSGVAVQVRKAKA